LSKGSAPSILGYILTSDEMYYIVSNLIEKVNQHYQGKNTKKD